jgi:mannose-1-phosphate guanylyltransferase
MFAVIMAGGSGTRFWPKSREKRPKQLLRIFDDRSLIQRTAERLLPLVPPENLFVVVTRSQAEPIREHLPFLKPSNLLVEPKGKNTAPCIGLASLYVKRMDPQAVIVVLPADHLIEDEEAFRQVLQAGEKLARDTSALITIGIEPTYPATGYGYIQYCGDAIEIDGAQAYRVKTFAEKPNLATAKRFLASGDFFWNSGIFIWRVDAILAEIEELLSQLHDGLSEIEAVIGTPQESEVIERVYAQIRSISIDYGVMEHAKNVMVLRGDFGWRDLGSWEEVYNLAPKDENGNAISNDPVALKDVKGCLIDAPERLVAAVGIEDLVIVDTPDALLICPRGRAQEVKDLVELIRRKKLRQYL